MPDRVRLYLSNITPRWPIEKQREVLSVHPGATEYVDVLRPAALKRRDPSELKARANLFRPTSRTQPETIAVADWPVLAWAWGDFADVIAAASERNAALLSVSTGRTIAPDASKAEVAEAIKTFAHEAKGRGLARSREELAELRRQDTARRVALIADDWGKPDAEFSTKELLERAGTKNHPMAPATARKLLGKRSKAQQLYAMRQAQEAGRQAARERRKAEKEAHDDE